MNSEQNNDINKGKSANSSRRKFLTKSASAGAMMTVVPSKSVWGACSVSGALSGGSQQGSCTFPQFYGYGRSHGFWKKPNSLHDAFNALASIKSQYGQKSAEYACANQNLIAKIDEVKGTPIVLHTYADYSTDTLNLGVALNENNTLGCHLAAIYLNAYFGFYNNLFPILIDDVTLNTPLELTIYAYAYTIQNNLSSLSGYYGENTTTSYYDSDAFSITCAP